MREKERKPSTMNNDCLANIYNFMETSQVVRMSKGAATERFPTKVELASISDVDQFNRWCEKFDTRRLQEVTFSIPTREFAAARGYPIGSVPPSVKRLTIRDDNFSVLAVPPTVEELVIERSQQRHIDLPNGIRRLVLGLGFNGSIRTFPATLEELTVRSWDQPWGLDASFPQRLQNIPETVHTIEIGEAAPVVVWRWPAGVQRVVLPQLHWGVAAWLERDHAPIPEGVEVEIQELSPFPPPAVLTRQYADPWWGEGEPPEWSDAEWDEHEEWDSMWD